MKARIWSLLALSLALCLVLSACSSNPDDEIATVNDPIIVEDPEPQAVSATLDAEPSVEPPELASVESPQPSQPEFPVEVTADSSTGIDVGVNLAPQGVFAGATAALEALDSYRFTTSFLFTGQDNGEVESGSIELSGDIMNKQNKHFVWHNLGDGEQFEIIQLDDKAWVYADEEWEAVPALVADAMSQAVLVFAPSVVWGGLFGGLEAESTYVGPEIIDGVGAHHYTSTYQQWAGVWGGEVLDATGDVWIAEAGYPLRYNFTATAVDEEGNHGTVSWSMQLTDAGGNIVIEPPM